MDITCYNSGRLFSGKNLWTQPAEEKSPEKGKDFNYLKDHHLDTSWPGVTGIVTFREGPPSVSQTQWGTCHIISQYVSKIHNLKFLLWYSNCKRSTLNSDQLLYIFAFPSTIISSSSRHCLNINLIHCFSFLGEGGGVWPKQNQIHFLICTFPPTVNTWTLAT